VNDAGTENEKKSLISSTEASYRFAPQWTLLGKYAGKYAWESLEGNDFTSYTDLILAGVTYALTDRWDVGVLGKIMNQYDTGMHSVGAVVKTGYRVYRNLYAGVGYNLSRMDDKDLSGSNYQSHGPFMELKFKFDENTLKGPAEPVKVAPPLPPPPPPADNVVLRSENIDTPVEVRGSVEMLTLLVNGVEVPLPTSDVSVKNQALDDVLEITGDRLADPVRFRVEVAPAGEPTEWTLAIMDAQGQVVRTLSGEGNPPGEILWNGRTEDDRLLGGGQLYQYQMVVAYADGSSSRSARRIFGVNRTSAISLSLTGSAFEFNSAVLSERARKALRQVADTLRKYPEEKVVIEGHTDGIGTVKYNLDLSRQRAEAAVACLVEEEHLPANRFLVKWYGKSKPIASNETPEGREINRRVEVKGEFRETKRAYVMDQYRAVPSVMINRSAVDLDSSGRFMTSMTGGMKRIDVEMRTAEGRSVRTSVPLPSLTVLEPSGVARFACGSNGEIYSVRPLPAGGEWKEDEKVMSYRLAGRTEPGNTVELYGKSIEVGPDGSFAALLDLRDGENVIGLFVRNQEGGTRIAHVKVSVSMERDSLHARKKGADRSSAERKANLSSPLAKGEISK
ncbi:MAG: OmpA family protein, partial [Deltaproteobacteria bacterium]|nr:OmpA family protein [Deltaproteobacteria bacterium]